VNARTHIYYPYWSSNRICILGEIIEKEGRLRELIRALRALASEDKISMLRSFGLL